MSIPSHYSDEVRPEHIIRTLVNETARIIDDLEVRREILRDLWSLHRDRGPFIDSIAQTWNEMPANDLLLIESEALILAQAFYRTLDEFRIYVAYTEDMPATLIERYDRNLERLIAIAEALIASTGVEPERPILDHGLVDPEVLKFFTPTWPTLPEGNKDAVYEEPEEIVITGKER